MEEICGWGSLTLFKPLLFKFLINIILIYYGKEKYIKDSKQKKLAKDFQFF